METYANAALRALYLEYVNNYLSIEIFAADHMISVDDAKTLLNMGRKYQNEYAAMFKSNAEKV